jgi:hypothetical protein
MGNDGETQVNLVSCLVKIGKPTQDSTNWPIDRDTCEYRWVHNIADFEVIKIMDDSQPYPTLMGLEWAFENQEIINLKRREMIFEVGDLKFTTIGSDRRKEVHRDCKRE